MNPFQLFSLEELPPAAAMARVEACMQEARVHGQVRFQAPDHAVRCLLDGAVRVGSRERVLDASAVQFARCLVVLAAVHELLRSGATCTVRDLYYRHRRTMRQGADEFESDAQCEYAVVLCTQLCACTRESLGLTVPLRGMACGLHPSGEICAIPTTPIETRTALARMASLPKGLRPVAIVVCEKYTVFHRLAQAAALRAHVPLLAVTAKGFPDVETRKFVCAASRALGPEVPVVGMHDYNPHGFLIMLTYKYGSLAQAGDGFRHVVPGMRILGLFTVDADGYETRRGGDLHNNNNTKFEAFTPADEVCIASLQAHPGVLANPAYAVEVASMAARKRKLQLDEIDSIQPGFLYDTWLANKLHMLL